ncbi:signal recognition particle-docking protein FtsY [Aliidiomarina quisquiliarum]|uniref:signal recognition particle-docking protein FtsY n=1 Tax=Aliidiomarina quisquiliarum TaxID=2938947 RepID=UPI00208EF03F|nr:signal recognition particle-docking protein FtsY [Aliidiomarina quisquiliarum]MCO4322192.1 signal recognition particle-docking protein FtsY [Aliidiomarina quisquiliarum]
MSEKGSLFSSWFRRKKTVDTDSVDPQVPEQEVPVENAEEPAPVEPVTIEPEPKPESESKPAVEAESAPAEPETVTATRPKKKSWLQRLREGLQKTSGSLGSGLSNLFRGKKIDDELFEELETHLLMADVGIETTSRIIELLTEHASRHELQNAEALYDRLKEEMARLLEPVNQPLIIPENHEGPFVILMVGVNGVGKTTTIGKLARQFKAEGKSVMLAAGDTFRAAAVEQLQVWGERNDIAVITQHTGADSASVLYDAVEAAKARGIDVLLADTAGRLQNKSNLMEELRKIVRVMQKIDPNMPHEVMLTLDAGTGQNAISQTNLFNETVPLTGLVMTKLDGTAKGGVIFALADQFKIPIRYIGVGEQLEDLRPFNANEFVAALFANNEAKDT